MSTSDSGSRSRTFNTDDPAGHGRLDLAWENLEQTLDHGGTASQLDIDDLDHIISDLVCIRHHGLADVEPSDTVRTIVTERNGQMTLESHATDEFGPLSVEDWGRRGS